MKLQKLATIGLLASVFGCGNGPIIQNTPVSNPTVTEQCEEVQQMVFDGFRYGGANCIYKHTMVYEIELKLISDINSLQTTETSLGYIRYGNYASASLVTFTEGKGFVPGEVLKISSPFPDYPAYIENNIDVGDYVVLKTVDTKVLGLPGGVVTSFSCNMDVELIAPVSNWQEITKGRVTFELDDCRMKSSEFYFPKE